ncbi:VanZ family protein [Paenibacillus sp. MMS20-IR301]|uniref:VanZ family protein n=1 Tax=Paenibacillus sp. MMS20-IR301 TaxID=2895946 RepID=UPI0028E2411E|nr:VanZ family protein [Paenibacillus sp. MMS20-IR301]WNS45691.1 VanZ family protein [Paenibacillus sp. MMS20-IR301]
MIAISNNRKRRSGGKPLAGRQVLPQGRRILAWLLLIAYSAMLIYWMFLGFGRAVQTEGPLRYNLEPLRTIRLYFDLSNGVSYSGRLVNLLGNVAVFVPFGILLPLVKPRYNSLFRLTLISVLGIFVLELMQMLLRVGSLDVDDLLLNLLGVWAGYALVRLIRD